MVNWAEALHLLVHHLPKTAATYLPSPAEQGKYSPQLRMNCAESLTIYGAAFSLYLTSISSKPLTMLSIMSTILIPMATDDLLNIPCRDGATVKMAS